MTKITLFNLVKKKLQWFGHTKIELPTFLQCTQPGVDFNLNSMKMAQSVLLPKETLQTKEVVEVVLSFIKSTLKSTGGSCGDAGSSVVLLLCASNDTLNNFGISVTSFILF